MTVLGQIYFPLSRLDYKMKKNVKVWMFYNIDNSQAFKNNLNITQQINTGVLYIAILKLGMM